MTSAVEPLSRKTSPEPSKEEEYIEPEYQDSWEDDFKSSDDDNSDHDDREKHRTDDEEEEDADWQFHEVPRKQVQGYFRCGHDFDLEDHEAESLPLRPGMFSFSYSN